MDPYTEIASHNVFSTLSHLLATDACGVNSFGVHAEDLTPAVWDAVFFGKPVPDDCTIDIQKLQTSFRYWACTDSYISTNTTRSCMMLYNHYLLFGNENLPEIHEIKSKIGYKYRFYETREKVQVKSLEQYLSTKTADSFRFVIANTSTNKDVRVFFNDDIMTNLPVSIEHLFQLISKFKIEDHRTNQETLHDSIFSQQIDMVREFYYSLTIDY